VFERDSLPQRIDGEVVGRVWSFRDITERKLQEAVLRRQALHDALTSTLNHASISALLHEHAAADETIGVVMVDVDGMKAINDVYGHQVGDAALVTVASALASHDAVVGRYGGDEFLVALPGVTREEAEAYCHHVLRTLAAEKVCDAFTQASVPVVASVGLAMFPEEAETVEEVIRLADNAMYTAKRDRQAREGGTSRGNMGDERAAKMVGEIVPLLTSPGDLHDKLRLVAHQLSIGAGYDLVRFNLADRQPLWNGSPSTTYTDLPEAFVNAWNESRSTYTDPTLVETLQRTRRPVLIDDVTSSEHYSLTQRALLESVGVHAILIVPMLWQDEMIGVLSVATKRESGLGARDAQFLSAVATQVTAIVAMGSMLTDVKAAAEHLHAARADTVMLLAASAEAHDQTTGRHLQRVRTIAQSLAAELGYSEEDAEAIGLAATLHDIGKLRVPETILLSPSQLTDRDWELMKQHTTWGAEFLAGRPGFELAVTIASAHHERWDGSGYPRGLAGDQIPEVAAIVSVADSLDAITNDRPYRVGRPAEWAVHEIVRCSGVQFSPRVVEALVRLHARQALPLPESEPEARAA